MMNTATTEIYTYGHTLSLHDALPIFGLRSAVCHAGLTQRKSLVPDRSDTGQAPPLVRRACGAVEGRADTPPTLAACPRSEEHTSELQSLMRNSYAVFCLKKKKKNKNTTSSHH